MKKYRWILLDADNTLLDFERCERDAFRDAASAFGVEPSDENLSLYSRINDALWKKLEQGLVTKEQVKYNRFSEFLRALGETENADENGRAMADCYMNALSGYNWELPGAYECCEKLSSCGYRLNIITNGVDFIQNRRVRGSRLNNFFDSVFISDEIHAQKPDRAFFDAVAAKIADFDREYALVVGDSLTSDIKGGINYGTDTCWLNMTGKTAPEDKKPTYIIKDISELTELLECE
ncbi:MAG: YjjG family noncanonical pyrimidine nucleotidase [Clostridia bacterium]|nr:YjjG family noncanonical pyrimidine nucleotidase [Clostridia bacterium]